MFSLIIHSKNETFIALLLLIVFFTLQGILMGIILAAITLRFRKVETLLNFINILIMLELVLPLNDIPELFRHILALIVPFAGTVIFYQQHLLGTDSLNILTNLFLTIINTAVLAFIAKIFYSHMLSSVKKNGGLGQY